VYNLLTGQSRYIPMAGGISTITCVDKKVIFYNRTGWYRYQAGKPITRLVVDFPLPKEEVSRLQTVSFKDTFYLTTNPSGTYYTLTLEANRVKMHQKREAASFINTISVDKGNVWVNTKTHSYTNDGKQVIDGMNLSDIITDSEGHRWMSSLKKWNLCSV